MKLPKLKMRYCPFCKKHTKHKVTQSKKRTRSTAHPMSWGSRLRVEQRGQARGHGNTGRYSKPPKPKMQGKKQTKKTDLRYECEVCKKQHMQSSGFRAKKLEFV